MRNVTTFSERNVSELPFPISEKGGKYLSKKINQEEPGHRVQVRTASMERIWSALPLCFGPQRSWGRTPPAEPWLQNEQTPQSHSPQVNPPAPPTLKKKRIHSSPESLTAALLYEGWLRVLVVTSLVFTDVEIL